jgi:pimeloyl-ACP methyl ester carboxylesterase
LTLTNCDTHDNWPPEAFRPFVEMVATGGLSNTLNAMLADKSIYRSPSALGPAYERPETATDEDIDIYLGPHLRSEQRTRDLERFVLAFDHKHTLAIEPQLRQLQAPTLIVWGTDDVYFPVKWAHWLAGAIPGAKHPVELPGAQIFFPEERAEAFNQLLRGHFSA